MEVIQGYLDLVDLVDIFVVAVLAWSALTLLRRTRARLALAGLAILGVIYALSRQLGLELTASILQGFFAVLVIVLVVVFQDDLRRFFEQIASWGLGRRPREAETNVQDLLVRTVARLSDTRTGALIVLPGREPLDRHVEGGIALGGQASEPLLLSLFDASSPGHDGAIILDGSVVERFAVHLPLSADRPQLGATGTRHAAALGVAERTDALCVVVSEERGTVSVAQGGALRALARPQDLRGELLAFFGALHPNGGETGSRRFQVRWRDVGIALGAALALWVVFVPGSEVEEVTLPAKVVVEKLPAGFVLESVEPPEVDVTLAGPRRTLYLTSADDLRVRLDALLVQLGRRTFSLSPQEVEHPEGLSVVDLQPETVKLSFAEKSPDAGQAAAADPR